MNYTALVNKLGEMRVIPVIALERVEDAMPLAEALIRGGLPCAEVTFRTAAAAAAIAAMSKRPELLVGAGTVLKVDQVKTAVEAGAKFIVSPGFNPKVVGYCVENGIPVFPGCSNPTDIEMALDAGLSVVKFFPAEAFGGLKTLKAIAAPYSMVQYIPTGGIDPTNLTSYLAFSKVLACGGSWMVKNETIRAGRFDEVERGVREAVAIAARARPVEGKK